MNRTARYVGLALLSMVGIWGCSNAASGDRVQQLESRITRLEDDLKSTTASRDSLKLRLAALEEQVRAEGERARMIERERDELTARLSAKAAEKDHVVAQYDDLVKKLEALLGHAKVAQARQAGQVPGTTTSLPK